MTPRRSPARSRCSCSTLPNCGTWAAPPPPPSIAWAAPHRGSCKPSRPISRIDLCAPASKMRPRFKVFCAASGAGKIADRPGRPMPTKPASFGALIFGLGLQPQKLRFGACIGLLLIDVPIAKLFDPDRDAGRRATHKGARSQNAKLAIEIFNLGFSGGDRTAFIAVHEIRALSVKLTEQDSAVAQRSPVQPKIADFTLKIAL